MRKIYHVILWLAVICLAQSTYSQSTVTMPAGAEYKRPASYQKYWGHNYRKEWIAPLKFPVLMLDTAFGGLKPLKAGGGHQSKSLHLIAKDGREYGIRTVNKTLKVLVPEIFHGTWIETTTNDEISMSHPYSALAVPVMATAAGLYHMTPRYVYIPKQAALDTFNEVYGDRLYLIEQRPAGNWSSDPNLGGFEKFSSSEKVREELFKDNKVRVDQVAFAKARIFDMFLGDWDRHEDQWKWGTKKEGAFTTYIPVPTDRDQAFSKYDGLILSAAAKSQMKYFQPFDFDIEFPEGYSYERRNVDRFFTNMLSLEDWQNKAKELQTRLTDQSIETSIKQLPPEIFAISGEDMIAKLKSRRSHLVEYATKYFTFLAKTIDVVGSKDREYFEVNILNGKEAEIKVFDMKDGVARSEPYYTRKVNFPETDEIRLYGLSGRDVYNISGSSAPVVIRVVGGNDKDSINNSSDNRIHIYDDPVNSFTGRSNKHLSSDKAVHEFDYDAFRPNKKGLEPLLGYNDEDRLYVGLGYGLTHASFRKLPFASKQHIGGQYSISQKAFSVAYKGVFTHVFGKTDLLVDAGYDWIRWTNFLGLGNETVMQTKPKQYYQMRNKQWFTNLGLQRKMGKSTLEFLGFYYGVDLIQDQQRFLVKEYNSTDPKLFSPDHFAGAALKFSVSQLDNEIVPEKGITFAGKGRYTRNLQDQNQSYADLGGDLQLYLPLIPKISLAVSGGGSTIFGSPKFYQYPMIGGGLNLRGFLLQRFHGKSTFYNSNELRFLTNFRSYIMNGKFGLLAFLDNGKVWMPSQVSKTWHTGYGGGILFAPFNIILLDVTYGISKEDKLIQVRVRKKL